MILRSFGYTKDEIDEFGPYSILMRVQLAESIWREQAKCFTDYLMALRVRPEEIGNHFAEMENLMQNLRGIDKATQIKYAKLRIRAQADKTWSELHGMAANAEDIRKRN